MEVNRLFVSLRGLPIGPNTLGHRSLATTERYLYLTITELKEAHRKHHPREKLGKGRNRCQTPAP